MARLRRYAGPEVGPSVLIVASPIKRPYIWDLSPDVSAVRFCLQHGLRVYLLEWTPPDRTADSGGLEEYTDVAISWAVDTVSEKESTSRPVVMGHSLGGPLATIYCALHPEEAAGLVLLSAQLCLHPGVSSFRDELATVAPAWLSNDHDIPGSLLSQISASASPATFVFSRLSDAAASMGDPRASDVRARIERWALDEVAVSGKLAREVFMRLYCENQLCEGKLVVGGRKIEPARFRLPTLAVSNLSDDVAPPASVQPFLEEMKTGKERMIEYPGEIGVVLQHLGILVGRDAFANIWPDIVSWIKARE